MAIKIPGLDVNSGLDLCGDNMEIYLNSLLLYVSGVPADLEKMRNVSRETLGDYSIIAHKVKNMSQYIGAEEAGKTAKQLETMASDGDLAGVLAHNKAFIKHAEKLVGTIRRWLAENHHDGA